MSKHTPEPWMYNLWVNGRKSITAAGTHQEIAEVWPCCNEGEQRANMGLMTAAPELLEACRMTVFEGACNCADDPDVTCCFCLSLAAIESAEGSE